MAFLSGFESVQALFVCYSLHCCWKSNYQEGMVGNGNGHQAHMVCL